VPTRVSDLTAAVRLIDHLNEALMKAQAEILELKEKLKGSPWSGNPEDWLLHAQHQLAEAGRTETQLCVVLGIAEANRDRYFGELVKAKVELEMVELAAETYHDAWVDAAAEVAALRAAAGPKEDPMDVVHDAMEGDWH
jgi:hypothetical protein